MKTQIIGNMGWPAVPTAKADKLPKQAKPARTKPPTEIIDITALLVTSDPIPPRRVPVAGGKYDELFESMEIGQGISCKTDHVGRVSASMREWIRRDKRSGVTASSVAKYETEAHQYDGTGRVWLVAKAKDKAAA